MKKKTAVKKRDGKKATAKISPAPRTLDAQQNYDKVTWKPGTMIYPLPVVMVSCGNPERGYNIITAAWTGITCTNPAMCYISLRPQRHSYPLIKELGEFCINLTTAELAFAVDWCGVKSGKDVDKFKEMKLTPVPAQFIAAPMIAQSPLNLECRVTQIIPLGSHDMFLAEILAVHATKKYLNPQTDALNLNSTHLLCFSHGKYYQLGEFKGKFGFSVQKKKKKPSK